MTQPHTTPEVAPTILQRHRGVTSVQDSQSGVDRYGRSVAGQIVTMGDGSQWFHPYSGSTPLLITAPTKPTA